MDPLTVTVREGNLTVILKLNNQNNPDEREKLNSKYFIKKTFYVIVQR